MTVDPAQQRGDDAIRRRASVKDPRRGEDPVESHSEESFPASDPPGWAGSGGVSREAARREEEPPQGPQATWTVERREATADDETAQAGGGEDE